MTKAPPEVVDLHVDRGHPVRLTVGRWWSVIGVLEDHGWGDTAAIIAAQLPGDDEES